VISISEYSPEPEPIKPEEVFQVEETKKVFISKKKFVEIRKLGTKDLLKLEKFSGKGDLERTCYLVHLGCKNPSFSYEDVTKMKPDILGLLSREIATLSGFTEEALRRARNLSTLQEDGISG